MSSSQTGAMDGESDTLSDDEQSGILVGPDTTVSPTLSVVMPTLNEEAGVGECITQIQTAAREIGVPTEVVVSDSSTDRTPEIAREMGARVVTPDRGGYGYAYQYAFKHARGEYIAIGDADTTYDFGELPRLFECLQTTDADMVMGSRFNGEIEDGAMPALHQYVGNPLLTAFLNFFYDTDVSDAHSGFRVFSEETLQQMAPQSNGMEFASEMVMQAGVENLDIHEVPITYHKREGEATLDSFSDGWRHVKFILRNAPGQLFSVPGLGMGTVGLVLMTVAFVGIKPLGQPFGIHSLIAGSLLILVGYQVASFGLLSDIASNPIRRSQDPVTRWFRLSFTLERGLLVGAMVFTLGSVLAGWLLFQWIGSGYESLPLVSADIVAFTGIVLGIQTMFGSFFASILADTRHDPPE